MSEHQQPETSKNGSFVDGKLIISVVVTIVVPVLALDFYGFLRHSKATDNLYVAEFNLVPAEPGTEQYISHRPATHDVICTDGMAVMESVVEGGPGGLLVDAKMRPVRCR